MLKNTDRDREKGKANNTYTKSRHDQIKKQIYK